MELSAPSVVDQTTTSARLAINESAYDVSRDLISSHDTVSSVSPLTPKALAGADISCRPLCLGGRWLSTRFIIDRYHLDPFQAEGRGLSLPAKGPSPASRLMLVGCITHPSPRAWGL